MLENIRQNLSSQTSFRMTMLENIHQNLSSQTSFGMTMLENIHQVRHPELVSGSIQSSSQKE